MRRIKSILDMGFGAGLIAGAIAALAMLALRFALGVPSVQELIVEKSLSNLSPRAFEFLLERFYSLGKPLAVLGTTVALAAAGGPAGVALQRALGRLPASLRRWWLLSGMLFGIALWLLVSLALTPLLGYGLFGANVTGGAASYSLATLVATALYGLAFARITRAPPAAASPTHQISTGMTRRAFLSHAAFWIVVVGAVGFGVRSLASGVLTVARSRVSPRDAGVLPLEITPNDRFYKVSKNFVDPEVDGVSWRLRIGGMVDNPAALTLAQLRSMPAVEHYQTLECISNPVGGDLTSNALWRGVSLRDLLDQAGVKPGALRITFRSADGYTETLPLDDAMRPEVLIAYEMNGVPLNTDHGFPARVLIPGRYGMKGPKWLEEIGTTDDPDLRGYWEQRGWDDRAEVKTTSQTLVPATGTTMPVEAAIIGGIAFSGDKGISQVEFSDDGGKTWHRGSVRPALSPYTWVLWTAEWRPPEPGRYRLSVRAYDAKGTEQDPQRRDPAPSGATGYHIITAVAG
ncbi:MAG: molybdopterin-binding oxidoreductase [SAR202 cluster bacterium]|nr:molybdopterin-binding oxidoreductase [SAR202 cluster bacterium]